jgi:proteasome lid subunit RPN8/RPN11
MYDVMWSHPWGEMGFADYVEANADVEVGGLFVVVQNPLTLPFPYVASEWEGVRFIESYIIAPNVADHQRGMYDCQSWRELRRVGEAVEGLFGGQYLEYHSHPSGQLVPSDADLLHTDGKPFCIVTGWCKLDIKPFFFVDGKWQPGGWLSWRDTKWGRRVNMNAYQKAYSEALRVA